MNIEIHIDEDGAKQPELFVLVNDAWRRLPCLADAWLDGQRMGFAVEAREPECVVWARLERAYEMNRIESFLFGYDGDRYRSFRARVYGMDPASCDEDGDLLLGKRFLVSLT